MIFFVLLEYCAENVFEYDAIAVLFFENDIFLLRLFKSGIFQTVSNMLTFGILLQRKTTLFSVSKVSFLYLMTPIDFSNVSNDENTMHSCLRLKLKTVLASLL